MDRKTNLYGFDLGHDDFLKSQAGPLSSISEEQHVQQSLFYLLTIRKGERTFAPNHGNELYNFMFRPNTENLRKEIAQHLRSVIREQEPRANDVDVKVESIPEKPTYLSTEINFRVANEKRLRSFSMMLDLQSG